MLSVIDMSFEQDGQKEVEVAIALDISGLCFHQQQWTAFAHQPPTPQVI